MPSIITAKRLKQLQPLMKDLAKLDQEMHRLENSSEAFSLEDPPEDYLKTEYELEQLRNSMEQLLREWKDGHPTDKETFTRERVQPLASGMRTSIESWSEHIRSAVKACQAKGDNEMAKTIERIIKKWRRPMYIAWRLANEMLEMYGDYKSEAKNPWRNELADATAKGERWSEGYRSLNKPPGRETAPPGEGMSSRTSAKTKKSKRSKKSTSKASNKNSKGKSKKVSKKSKK